MDGRKRRRLTSAQLSAGDIIRIPVGLVLLWLAVVSIVKGIGAFAPEPVAIIVGCLGIAVGVVFLAIGFVMAFGWIGAWRRR